MDYEQKYKDALERARVYKKHGYMVIRATLDNIFPELKESEDEKIRKEIISALKWANHKGVYDKHIAWLEKQGNNNNHNWKPSEEQINALEHFIRSIAESGYASPYDDNTKLLKALINDLRKSLDNLEQRVDSLEKRVYTLEKLIKTEYYGKNQH